LQYWLKFHIDCTIHCPSDEASWEQTSIPDMST
jgi:hypothetical protein